MTLPKLATTSATGFRTYRHPLSGAVVPSVTTIIKHGLPKPELIDWSAGYAARYAVANWKWLTDLPAVNRVELIKSAHSDYADSKGKIGDVVHELIDSFSTGVPYPEWPSEVDSFTKQFIAFMTVKRPLFIENEVTVWSHRYGYAGSADFIAEIDGKTVLGDVKTGKRVYPEVGLQLAALAHADSIIRDNGEEEPMPDIERLYALHIRPRSWKLIPVFERGECFAAFRACKAVMEWDRIIAPNVLLGALCLTGMSCSSS